MNKIYDDNKLIDINNLSLLSTRGSEVFVYCDSNYVYKIFKEDYKLEHKSKEELDLLASFNTSRILMPKSKLISEEKLVGYKMCYIKGTKNILEDKMSNLLNELLIIKDDIELLSENNVRLIDINKSNIVYNGRLFFVDPGNYYINNINDLLIYYQDKIITEKEKINIIKKWNYDKINKLIYELLFMGNSQIDFYLSRKIIEFFEQNRTKENILYDFDVYTKYFDKELLICDSIHKFVTQNIKEDKEEKEKILSLFQYNNYSNMK